MRHRLSSKKLGRTYEHRKALLNNMAISIIKHERIVTTLVKAKLVRRTVEKLITLAKKGGLANIRHIEAVVRDKDIVGKLVNYIAPRYKERQGGYTRILKLKNRKGDNALTAIIELVDRVIKEKKVKKAADPKAEAVAKAKKAIEEPKKK
ncbi:MAG: 50S ribosomal protein L17 [Candidatus Firestonebacteria bacterium]